MNRKTLTLLVALAVVCLVAIGVSMLRSSDRDDRLASQIGSQQLLIDRLAVQIDAAIDQGASVVEPDVIAAAVPDAEVTTTGPQGDRGDAGATGATGDPGVGVGPTAAEIGAAIDVYCQARNGCLTVLSQPEIVAAVTVYCATVDCRGPPGEPGPAGGSGIQGVSGPAGQNGADGTPGTPGAPGAAGADGAPGAPGGVGPGPTVAEIDAAVAAFLAANPPPAGPPGANGVDGLPGANGVDGQPGPQGEPGPAGANGLTPTQMTCILVDPIAGSYDCTVTASA
jgi:collagen triple helix repeat protein